MSKKKLGVIRKGILKLKLNLPVGLTLSTGETIELIDVMKKDSKTLDDNHKDLVQAELRIKRNMLSIPDTLTEVMTTRSEATRYFKVTKDPIKRREWARRLVVADKATKQIQASRKRMEVMQDRVKTLVQDAYIEKQALEIRINEAEAYREMGQGIQLVGEKLVHARSRAKSQKIHFSNLEVLVEGLEKSVSADSPNIIEQAEKILSTPTNNIER